MRHNALIYKWLIGNAFGFLILFMIWRQGWIGLVLRSDASYLTWVMSALFIVFWLVSSYRVFIINKESNQFAMGNSEGIGAKYFEKLRIKSRNQNGNAIDQGMLASTLRGELVMSIHVIQYISNTLILLGLIGTVVGFVIAVSGLGVTLGQGDDMEQVKGALGQIIDGMSVALFTTLVGSVLGGLWLQVHYQILLKAISTLVFQIVERAELEIIPGLQTGGGHAAVPATGAPKSSAPDTAAAPSAG